MTKFLATALCTGAATSAGLLFIATALSLSGQTREAGLCLLSAGAVLYGMCLVIGWNMATTFLKGK